MPSAPPVIDLPPPPTASQRSSLPAGAQPASRTPTADDLEARALERRAAMDRLQSDLAASARHRRMQRLDTLVAKAPEQYLRLGTQEIKSLRDLASYAQNMPAEEFARHVGSDKNDFAEWVRSTLQDDDWADAISRATTKDALIAAFAGL
jgi:hypothetical protein